ncbi:UNVERIFIED_CONTAM: 1-aminocyclopropane-1-carboxylate oxidase1 [Sesamum latifolium]|uniref:1-aminocyclopropane-1-carboxylate oxidase1 n=1 Tax=Sesamum latifolium TaxID=2727402 RepID=A0AAW2Y073_9LAMI
MAVASTDADYDWATEVKKFNDAKSGVKGLVDAGVTKLPRFFLHPPENLPHPASPPCTLELPIIDFGGGGRRAEVVGEIRKAASTWGFFRIVNHGVPVEVMEAMLAAVKRFHEQPAAEKMGYYTGNRMDRVRFTSSVPKRESDAACWRDLLTIVYQDDQLDPQIVPLACSNERNLFTRQKQISEY